MKHDDKTEQVGPEATLQVSIREVLGLNLGWGTGSSD
jgi:hypothetical protein